MGSIKLGSEDLKRLQDRFDMVGQGFESSPALNLLRVGVFWEVFKDEGGVSEKDQVGLGQVAISDIIVSLVCFVSDFIDIDLKETLQFD